MDTFGAVIFETELKKVTLFLNAAKANIVFAIKLLGAALFYLLKVTQAAIGIAYAYAESAVGKVDEQFAAMQFVSGEGFSGIAALWGMCQHQYCQLVLGVPVCKAYRRMSRNPAPPFSGGNDLPSITHIQLNGYNIRLFGFGFNGFYFVDIKPSVFVSP